MAKIRKTASIENGLMEVVQILSEEEIQAAIGKGSSYVRNVVILNNNKKLIITIHSN